MVSLFAGTPLEAPAAAAAASLLEARTAAASHIDYFAEPSSKKLLPDLPPHAASYMRTLGASRRHVLSVSLFAALAATRARVQRQHGGTLHALLCAKLRSPFHPPFVSVLDLDGVLVKSDWNRERGWRTFKRPGVDAFLKHMAQARVVLRRVTALRCSACIARACACLSCADATHPACVLLSLAPYYYSITRWWCLLTS